MNSLRNLPLMLLQGTNPQYFLLWIYINISIHKFQERILTVLLSIPYFRVYGSWKGRGNQLYVESN